MKRTIIAVLASLMLAGAISAVTDGSPQTATGMIVLMGDGTSPLPDFPSSTSPIGTKLANQ